MRSESPPQPVLRPSAEPLRPRRLDRESIFSSIVRSLAPGRAKRAGTWRSRDLWERRSQALLDYLWLFPAVISLLCSALSLVPGSPLSSLALPSPALPCPALPCPPSRSHLVLPPPPPPPSIAKIGYTISFPNGDVFDTNFVDGSVDEPVEFTLGAGKIIPLFDITTLGLEEGESRKVEVSKDDHPFGEPAPLRDVPASALPEGASVGDRIGSQKEGWNATIVEIKDA